MITLLVIWGALAAGPARAATPAEAVRDAVAAHLSVSKDDVEVSGIGVLPGAPVDADWAVTLPNAGPLTGDLRVTVRSGAARYTVVPHVTVWRSLPVAADAVAANAPVHVTMARVSSDRLRGAAPVDPDASWAARVDLAAGDPLTVTTARPCPDAPKGSEVRILAGEAPLSITAPGQLLDDGFVGGRVAVLNLATRVVVTGTYRGDALVVLEQR
jgi:flagella basal body P-ring formation protein FlgA